MKRATKGRGDAPTEELRVRAIVLVDAQGNEWGRLGFDANGNAGLRLWHAGGFLVDLRAEAEAAGLTIDHGKREDQFVAGLNAYSQSELGLHGYGVLTLNDDGADAGEDGGTNRHAMQAEHVAELRSLRDWAELRAMPPDVRHEATLLATARRGMTDRQWETVRALISAGYRAALGADAAAAANGKEGAAP